MRKLALILPPILCLLFAPVCFSQTAGWLTFTASNVQSATSAGGKLGAGILCLQPVDANNHPLAVTAGGSTGGIVLSTPSCTTVTNGAITSMQVIDTALSAPTNPCLRLTIVNDSGIPQIPATGFTCLQPSSSNGTGTAANAWCSTAGGVTTCNLDRYPPNVAAQAIVQAGPAGATGPAGAGYIAGLSSDGSNGITVTNKVTAGTLAASNATLGPITPTSQAAAASTLANYGARSARINILFYGAVADGNSSSPTDNTAAVNNAIQAIIAKCGGTIFFPAGLYGFTGNLRFAPTSAQLTACAVSKSGFYNMNLVLEGDGPQSSWLINENTSGGTLLTLSGESERVLIQNIGVVGRGYTTAGNLLENLSAATSIHHVYFAGTGGRCLLDGAERLQVTNSQFYYCRQAIVQNNFTGTNESYFTDNNEFVYTGIVVDPLTGAGQYNYNVNAVAGVFPSSGNVVADMHAAIVLGNDQNNLIQGCSIKPTGQGLAGIRVTQGENIKISHCYIEGAVSPSANASIIVGGKNETSTLTSAMTTTSTTLTVANAMWFFNVLGSAADVQTAYGGSHYTIYPPDYVYGGTSASSIGGGILTGSIEEILLGGWVGPTNTGVITGRAQGGTTAYAWPVGAIVNEGDLPSQGTSADAVILEDDHFESRAAGPGAWTVVSSPDAQQSNAEIVVGWMPDLAHTWAHTGSDYNANYYRRISLTGNTRFRTPSPGAVQIEADSEATVIMDSSYGETVLNGLVAYGGVSIVPSTYISGRAPILNISRPNFGSLTAPSGSWPSWLVPAVTTSGQWNSLAVAASGIPTSALASVAGVGAGLVTGPKTGTTTNHAACFADTSGTLKDCGTGVGIGTVTSFSTSAWPSWMTPTVTNASSTPALAVAVSAIPNSALANPSVTVNGQTCTLGSSCTVTASPATAFTTLTDGSTVTLATGGSGLTNATLTLSHSTSTRTLNVTGLVSGANFTVVLEQDSTGGAALTFGTGCTWYLGTNSGFTASTTPALTAAANGINMLAVLYDGTNCYANVR
jgi:hypothetical protein